MACPPRLAGPAQALAFVLLGLGCAHLPRPTGPETEAWRDALLLDASPAARLRLEVDRIEGSEPRPRALARFLDTLDEVLDKPGGLHVVLDTRIERPAWPGADHQAVRALAIRRRDHPPSRSRENREAGMHLLYAPRFGRYRGYTWTRDSMSREPGRHDGPLLVILTDRLRPILWLTGAMQERSVLVHELGHALGLVGDPSHGFEAHCTDAACVMYGGVDARSAARWLFPALFGGQLPLRWCDACSADLRPRSRNVP